MDSPTEDSAFFLPLPCGGGLRGWVFCELDSAFLILLSFAKFAESLHCHSFFCHFERSEKSHRI
ncbi:hypothetical protein [Helicobacter sp. 23-1045]